MIRSLVLCCLIVVAAQAAAYDLNRYDATSQRLIRWLDGFVSAMVAERGLDGEAEAALREAVPLLVPSYTSYPPLHLAKSRRRLMALPGSRSDPLLLASIQLISSRLMDYRRIPKPQMLRALDALPQTPATIALHLVVNQRLVDGMRFKHDVDGLEQRYVNTWVRAVELDAFAADPGLIFLWPTLHYFALELEAHRLERWQPLIAAIRTRFQDPWVLAMADGCQAWAEMAEAGIDLKAQQREDPWPSAFIRQAHEKGKLAHRLFERIDANHPGHVETAFYRTLVRYHQRPLYFQTMSKRRMLLMQPDMVRGFHAEPGSLWPWHLLRRMARTSVAIPSPADALYLGHANTLIDDHDGTSWLPFEGLTMLFDLANLRSDPKHGHQRLFRAPLRRSGLIERLEVIFPQRLEAISDPLERIRMQIWQVEALVCAGAYERAAELLAHIEEGPDIGVEVCGMRRPTLWGRSRAHLEAEIALFTGPEGAALQALWPLVLGEEAPTVDQIDGLVDGFHDPRVRRFVRDWLLLAASGTDLARSSLLDIPGAVPFSQLVAQLGEGLVFEYLIEHDYDIAFRDRRGQSLMHLAAARGTPRSLELLVERGFDRNLLDRHRKTPLHAAVLAKQPDTVRWLRDHGGRLAIGNAEMRAWLTRMNESWEDAWVATGEALDLDTLPDGLGDGSDDGPPGRPSVDQPAKPDPVQEPVDIDF